MSRIVNLSLLIFFSLLLFLPGILYLPVIDRDEAHFAQASRQMLESGNFLQVRFQEKTRFRKPPGINWLQATALKIWGEKAVNQIWVYRLPSLLSSILSLLLTVALARYYLSFHQSLLCGLLLCTSLLFVVESHMAVIDPSLLTSVVLMQLALFHIYQKGKLSGKVNFIWVSCFWFAMSYGVVLKGVNLVVGFASIICLILCDNDRRWLKSLRFFPGFSILVLVTLLWLVAVSHAENSNYLVKMLKTDLLPKLKGGHESHGKPPLFHLLLLPITLWPASLFLYSTLIYSYKNRHDPLIRFLLAWILPTWFFFELMPTKLPQYVLPTFPAIIILIVRGLVNSDGLLPSKTLKILQGLWGALSFGIAFFILLVSKYILGFFSLISLTIAGLISFLSLVAIHFIRKSDYKKSIITCLGMAVFTYPLIFSIFLPQLKPAWLSENIIHILKEKHIAERSIIAVGFDEPSFVFKTKTEQVHFCDQQTAQLNLSQNPGQIAIINKSYFNANFVKRYDLLAEVKGFNYSKGHWLDLVIIQSKKES